MINRLGKETQKIGGGFQPCLVRNNRTRPVRWICDKRWSGLVRAGEVVSNLSRIKTQNPKITMCFLCPDM